MKTKRTHPSASPQAKTVLPLRRFLVPIDFSPRSRLAVKYAGALARKSGARIELLFVIEPPPFYSGLEYTPLTLDPEELARTARERMEKQAATLLPSGVEARVSIRRGKAFAEIAAHAREHHVDLILIPTHGYSGAERALMGSTAEQVVRHAPCAVLTLRLDARAGGVRREPHADVPHLRRILAPVDFSEASGKAMQLAAELAGRFQSNLTALHVVFSAPPPRRLAAFARRLDQEAIGRATKELAALVRRKLPGHALVTTEIVAGLPRDEIVRAAARWKADLIVIATRGRTGLKRWFMGSTAEQVIRYAPCPVLVVRQPEHARHKSPPRKASVPAGSAVPLPS